MVPQPGAMDSTDGSSERSAQDVQRLRERLVAAKGAAAAVADAVNHMRDASLRAWSDEEPALRTYAETMAATAAVMRRELDVTTAELHAAAREFGGAAGARCPSMRELHA